MTYIQSRQLALVALIFTVLHLALAPTIYGADPGPNPGLNNLIPLAGVLVGALALVRAGRHRASNSIASAMEARFIAWFSALMAVASVVVGLGLAIFVLRGTAADLTVGLASALSIALPLWLVALDLRWSDQREVWRDPTPRRFALWIARKAVHEERVFASKASAIGTVLILLLLVVANVGIRCTHLAALPQ